MTTAIAAAAAAAANAAPQQPIVNPPRAFKPYGSPPSFDLEAERDSFGVQEERGKIFLALSTINEVLDAATSPARGVRRPRHDSSSSDVEAAAAAAEVDVDDIDDEIEELKKSRPAIRVPRKKRKTTTRKKKKRRTNGPASSRSYRLCAPRPRLKSTAARSANSTSYQPQQHGHKFTNEGEE
jgi:hypothetical protein